MTERTYRELHRRAAMHLARGRPVVLDAMHGREEERAAARALAQEHGVPHLIVGLGLDEAAARERIAGREDDPLRTSDATWEVYTMQRERYPGSTEPATRFGCRDTQTGAPLKLG